MSGDDRQPQEIPRKRAAMKVTPAIKAAVHVQMHPDDEMDKQLEVILTNPNLRFYRAYRCSDGPFAVLCTTTNSDI